MVIVNERIVIVDDEPITRLDIRDILEQAGYEVVGEAGDGFEAIDVCQRQKPDWSSWISGCHCWTD